MNEDVLCLYADLDRLIETAGLSKTEMLTVKLMMRGYSLTDIAEHYGKTKQSFEVCFKRATAKIVAQNMREWESVYKKK